MLETAGVPNASQAVLNIIPGSNIQAVSDSSGGVTITGSGDSLIHGDAIWEHDSAYVELRDDFVPDFNTNSNSSHTSQLGELGWYFAGTNPGIVQQGGSPPNMGNLGWSNTGISGQYFALVFNANNTNVTGTFARNSFALLENPGWKATWIWKVSGFASGVGDFQTTKKSIYVGLSGAGCGAVINSSASARPDTFIGVRYDTSSTPGTLTLSSVANASGGSTNYTGTITGGGNGAYIGLTFIVAGFTTGANNGSFVCTQSSTTTLTLANAGGVAETHAATASASGLNDSFYTFEVVENPQYSSLARHNLQGQTFVTTVAPTAGVWNRLDISCTADGVVTLTLNGNISATFTVPKVTVTMNSQASVNSHIGRVFTSPGTTGTNTIAPWIAGSVVSLSGYTGTNLPLNGTWTLFSGDGGSLYFDAPLLANIGNNSASGTAIGYPALTPILVSGNDDSSSPSVNTIIFWVDYFSLVWNPGVGGGTGTPDPTKSRYW